jgi:succinate dehydrogenase / fumarate reductase iron-sulfur subunit
LGHKLPQDALNEVERIFDIVESRDERDELNLYISGYDEDADGAQDTDDAAGGQAHAGNTAEQGQPGQEPEESPVR